MKPVTNSSPTFRSGHVCSSPNPPSYRPTARILLAAIQDGVRHPAVQYRAHCTGNCAGWRKVDAQFLRRRRAAADGDRDERGECLGRGRPSLGSPLGPLLGEPSACPLMHAKIGQWGLPCVGVSAGPIETSTVLHRLQRPTAVRSVSMRVRNDLLRCRPSIVNRTTHGNLAPAVDRRSWIP